MVGIPGWPVASQKVRLRLPVTTHFPRSRRKAYRKVSEDNDDSKDTSRAQAVSPLCDFWGLPLYQLANILQEIVSMDDCWDLIFLCMS